MDSYQSTIAQVHTIIYTLCLGFFITPRISAIHWLLLVSILSTIILSQLAAHLLDDPNIIIFQFMYWCISWTWSGWNILPCKCFHDWFLQSAHMKGEHKCTCG